MSKKKKFYRTVIQMEILSEQPIRDASMSDIAYQTDEGDWSGKNTTVIQDDEITGPQAAVYLSLQGSDPEFFGLDAEGNELD